MRYPFILHHGAVTGVTGFCHQLQMGGEHALLVDGGLFQGSETSPEGRAAANSLHIDFSLVGVRTLVANHVYREIEPFWDAEALTRARSRHKPLICLKRTVIRLWLWLAA